MRPVWIFGITIATALSMGCGGSDQTDTNGGKTTSGGGDGGSAGGNTGGSGGANTGGAGSGGANTGGSSTGGANTGGANTGGANTGGTGTGGANTGGSTGTGPCTPLAADGSKIGATCGDDTNCPTGYTCHETAGIVVSKNCAILCEEACQCPMNLACVTKSDKAMTWKECDKP